MLLTDLDRTSIPKSGRSREGIGSIGRRQQGKKEPRMMKVLKEESGQTLVVVTIFMSLVAVGFLALALDTGYLFRERRMVQSAADAAAVAAAEEVATGNSSNKQAVANAMAKLNGFDTTLAKNPAVVTFPTPTGVFSGSNYVAVTVSKPIPTFFMAAFSSKLATETVSATATAGGGQLSQTCVCLNGGSGRTLYVSGGSHLNATSCGIVDNSNASNGVAVDGGSSLSAGSLGLSSSSTWTASNISGASGWAASEVTGGASETLNGVLNGTPVPGVASCAPTLPPTPTYDSTRCAADPGGSYKSPCSFSPASYAASGAKMGGCYSGLTVGTGSASCTLGPGIYVVTGQLSFIDTANSGGNGVFFYLTSTASLSISNGGSPNLVAGGSMEKDGVTSAPSLGAGYDGMAIYQASGNAKPLVINGGSNSYINGAIYAPSAAVTASNGSTMLLPVGGIYAKSLSVIGGTTLNVIQDTNEGAVSIGSPKLVQ
jgi:Flp pilus assembly protein TadG